ncbi:MAG TPA: O-antigen ligase family protein [Rhizomicrobium sp.]
MAASAVRFAAVPRTLLPAWVAEGGFVLFLLLVFVGIQPFNVRDYATLAIGESGFAGEGDSLRQVLYLASLAMIALAAFDKRGVRAFLGVPIPLALLLGWACLSALWADAPGVTFRRAGLEIVVVLSAILSVDTLGFERSLRLLRNVLGCVLIANWISIPLIPQAVHQAGEMDPSLVGDWRGMFFHKNIAGSATALSAIIFLYYAVERKSRADLALLVAAIGFVVMTHSKSSIGLLPIAIFFGSIYRLAWQRGIDRAIVSVVLAVVIVAGVTLAIIDSGLIARALENPAEFTGRAQIWQAEVAFIHDHLLLGSGFGTFADTGAASPLRNYVAAIWVQNISHGHNAYLQLFVTMGSVGLALAMIAFVIQPFLAYVTMKPQAIVLAAPLFTIFCFMILHNFLESDFLEGDGPAWVIYLISLALLRHLPDAAEEKFVPRPAGTAWLAR